MKGVATNRNGKLSPRMLEVLEHAAEGRPLDTGCRTRAAHGGLSATMFALRHRGLLRGLGITEAGRQVLADAGSRSLGQARKDRSDG